MKKIIISVLSVIILCLSVIVIDAVIVQPNRTEKTSELYGKPKLSDMKAIDQLHFAEDAGVDMPTGWDAETTLNFVTESIIEIEKEPFMKDPYGSYGYHLYSEMFLKIQKAVREYYGITDITEKTESLCIKDKK